MARASAQLSVPTEPLTSVDEGLTPLAEHPDLLPVTARIDAHERRLRIAIDRKARAENAARLPKPTRPVADRAADLVDGGTVPSSDPRAEAQAAESEIMILRHALSDLNLEKAEISSRLSYEMSLRFQGRHVAALRRMDAAIGDVWEAMRDMIEIAEALVKAGYVPSPVALPANVPALVCKLGNPDDCRSVQAWTFRRWLEKTFPTGAK